MEIITLNVGGKILQTKKDNLQNPLLRKFLEECVYDKDGNLFIDQDYNIFVQLLNRVRGIPNLINTVKLNTSTPNLAKKFKRKYVCMNNRQHFMYERIIVDRKPNNNTLLLASEKVELSKTNCEYIIDRYFDCILKIRVFDAISARLEIENKGSIQFVESNLGLKLPVWCILLCSCPYDKLSIVVETKDKALLTYFAGLFSSTTRYSIMGMPLYKDKLFTMSNGEICLTNKEKL